MTEQGTIERMYPPGKHPNSLANLRPWSPGQSGCPSGQRASGAYVAEWRNAMLAVKDDGTPSYTRADLEAIVADDAAPPVQIIAATWILNCMKTGENWVIGKDGKLMPARIDSEPGRERERLMDRIEGKPALSQIDLMTMLRFEAALLAGPHRSWSSDLLLTNGQPLIEADPDRLADMLGVDASKPYFRHGRWVASP